MDLLAVKNFDELIYWLVYFRCKLNQWNRSLGMVGRVLDVCVFWCGRIIFQLTKADVGGFSRRLIGLSCSFEVALEIVISGEFTSSKAAIFTASHMVKFTACQVFSNNRLFPNKNVKYRNELPSFQILRANYQSEYPKTLISSLSNI